MIPVTDIVSMMRVFCHLHHVANQPIHPAYAATMAAMLGDCETRVFAMEFPVVNTQPVQPVPGADGEQNVIYPNFTRSAPPPSDGGDAA